MNNMKECSKVLEMNTLKYSFFNTRKDNNREYYYDKDSWSIVVKLSTKAKIKSLLMLPLVIPVVAVVWTLAGLAEVFTWLTAKVEGMLQTHLHTNKSEHTPYLHPESLTVGGMEGMNEGYTYALFSSL